MNLDVLFWRSPHCMDILEVQELKDLAGFMEAGKKPDGNDARWMGP